MSGGTLRASVGLWHVPAHLPTHAPGSPLRFAVLTTRWHPEVLARLSQAALATLRAGGVADADILALEVPGAFELPQAAAWLAREGWGGPLDGIVALGLVLRGETPHFDLVVRAVGDGLLRVALDTGVPVGLGVITADTRQQAEMRSAPPPAEGGSARSQGATPTKGGNKGVEAAQAALEMARTRRALGAAAAHRGSASR